MQANLNRLRDCFAEACSDLGGLAERRLNIAGREISLRAAGNSLIPQFTGAFDHLIAARPSEKPDLVINVWEGRSPAVKGALLPRNIGDDMQRGIYRAAPGLNRPLALYELNHEQSFGYFYDIRGCTIYYWATSSRYLPYMHAYPLEQVLHWWAWHEGLQGLHAAAIGTGEGAVLIAGPSGAGKSTLALACLNSGLSFLGDDLCLMGGGGPYAIYSLYCSAKFGKNSLDLLRRAGGPDITPSGQVESKWLLLANRYYPTQILTRAPLKGIVLPIVGQYKEPCLKSASPIEMIQALAKPTIEEFRVNAEPMRTEYFRRITEMICRVKTYKLEMNENLAAATEAIRTLVL